MADIRQLRKERERDILESLKIIDFYVEWIKKTPNKVWSKQQADLFKSVYDSINQDWKRSHMKAGI